jgi:hypothetical protein
MNTPKLPHNGTLCSHCKRIIWGTVMHFNEGRPLCEKCARKQSRMVTMHLCQRCGQPCIGSPDFPGDEEVPHVCRVRDPENPAPDTDISGT